MSIAVDPSNSGVDILSIQRAVDLVRSKRGRPTYCYPPDAILMLTVAEFQPRRDK